MKVVLAVAVLLVVYLSESEGKTRRKMLPAAFARDPRFFYDVDEKIVGGSPAVDGQFPEQVSFQDSNSDFHFCGGSILNEKWIITAAHCVSGEDFANPQNLRIVAGNLRHDKDAADAQASAVVKIVSHEDYIAATFTNDIALLELGTPLTFNDNVAPVILPSSGQQSSGNCVVSGWGTTSSGGSASQNLLYVQVPVVSDSDCDESYPSQIAESMLCAGEEGKDSCQGDSGGPLYCDGLLSGIVSWGRGCALAGYPGVYTEVSYFVDWIVENTA